MRSPNTLARIARRNAVFLLMAGLSSMSTIPAAGQRHTTIVLEYPTRDEPLRRLLKNGTPVAGAHVVVPPGTVLMVLKHVNTLLYDVEIKGKTTQRFSVQAFLDLTKPASTTEAAAQGRSVAQPNPEMLTRLGVRDDQRPSITS